MSLINANPVKPTPSAAGIDKQLHEARSIASQLLILMREDAMHRTDLYQVHSDKNDALRWTPDFYRRCQLLEALCRKLDALNGKPGALERVK